MKNKAEYIDDYLLEKHSGESSVNTSINNSYNKINPKFNKWYYSTSSSQNFVFGMIENCNTNEEFCQTHCNSSLSSQIILFDNNDLNKCTSMKTTCKKYDSDRNVIWLYKCTVNNNSWRAYSSKLSSIIECNYRNGVKCFLYYPFVFDLSSFKQVDLVTGKESYLLRNRDNTEFFSPFFFEYSKATSIYLIDKVLNYIKYDNLSLIGNINRAVDYWKHMLRPSLTVNGKENGKKIKPRNNKASKVPSSSVNSICDSLLFPEIIERLSFKAKNEIKSRMILDKIKDSYTFSDCLDGNNGDKESNENCESNENDSNFVGFSNLLYVNCNGGKSCTDKANTRNDHYGISSLKDKDITLEKEDARELVNLGNYARNGSGSCLLFTPHNYRKGLGIIVPKVLSYKWNKNSRRTDKDKNKYVRFNFGMLSPDIHKKSSGVKNCYIGTPRRGVGGSGRNMNSGTNSSSNYNNNVNSKLLDSSKTRSSLFPEVNSNTTSVHSSDEFAGKTDTRNSKSEFVATPIREASPDVCIESIKDVSQCIDLSNESKPSNFEIRNTERHILYDRDKLKLNSLNLDLSSLEVKSISTKFVKDNRSKSTHSRRKSKSSVINYTYLLEIEDWISVDTIFGCESEFNSRDEVGKDNTNYYYKKKDLIGDEKLKDWYYYYHCSTDTDGYCYGNDRYIDECDIFIKGEKHNSYKDNNNICGIYIGIDVEFQDDYNCEIIKDETDELVYDYSHYEDDESHRSICFEDLSDFISDNGKKIRWWFNHSIKHVTVDLNSYRDLGKKKSALKKNNKKIEADVIPLIHPLLTGYLNELDVCESSILFSNTLTPSSIKILETQSKVLLGLKNVNINSLKPRKSEFSSISEFCFKETSNIVPISLIEFKMVHSTIPISLFSMLLTRFPVPAANTFVFSFICNDDNIPNTGMQTVHIFNLHLSQNQCSFYRRKKKNKLKNGKYAANMLDGHSCNHIHLDIFRRYNKVKICPWLAISNFIDEFVLRTPILVKCIIDMHNIMIIPSKKRYTNSSNSDNNKFLKLNNSRDGSNKSGIDYDKNYVEFVILTANLLLPLLIINSHSIQNIVIGPDNNDLSREIHDFDGKSLANLRIDSMIFTKKRLPFTFYNIRNFDLFLDHNIDKTELGIFISGKIKNLTGSKSVINNINNLPSSSVDNITSICKTTASNSRNPEYLNCNIVNAEYKTYRESCNSIGCKKLYSEFDKEMSSIEGFSEKLFDVIQTWINEFLYWFDRYVLTTIERLNVNLYLTSGFLEAKNFGYDSIVNEKLYSQLDSELFDNIDIIKLKQRFILNSKAKHPLLDNVSFNIFISNHLKLFTISLTNSNNY
ncbi:putative WWE domain [Cryptosporidium bovis]|uniref:putative WWE domain n=1 Tax=Cryptosporidium bovis TaxID=310047 RepID=UPI003519F65B|nr:putative WWE domain [Cryptosporidium bovis]